MIQLHVDPLEYLEMQKAVDRATATIDGQFNESIWLQHLRQIFDNETVTALIVARDVDIVVHFNDTVTTRITRNGA